VCLNSEAISNLGGERSYSLSDKPMSDREYELHWPFVHLCSRSYLIRYIGNISYIGPHYKK